MSDLPKGWVVCKVGDVIQLGPRNVCDDEIEVGFVPLQRMGVRYREVHTFEVRKWAEVKSGYTHFKDGDVLLARITPSFENGKAGIAQSLPNGIGAGSTEYIVCRPTEGAVSAELLLAHFKTQEFLTNGKQLMSGAVGQQRVPKSYVESCEFPLAPFNEQKRIADKLDTLLSRVDACRERLDRVPAILKRFRQSILAAACSGQLTEEWRLLQGLEPTQEFPKTWSSCKIGDVGRVQLGRQRSPRFHAGDCMHPYLRVQNIFEDRIDLSDVMTMDFPGHDYERYQLHPGDILLNEGQSPQFLGRPALYRGELPGVCFTNTLIRFQANANVYPEYALLVFRNHMHSGRYVTEGRITTNIAHLGAGRFAEVEFPLPPMDEQAEIIRRTEALLGHADRFQACYTTVRSKVNRLTPSLLAKAFRGELVPQDPNDEPADELLARIRTTCESAVAKSPGKKAAGKLKVAKDT